MQQMRQSPILKCVETKFNQNTYLDPYVIIDIRNNDTVWACKVKVTDTFKNL